MDINHYTDFLDKWFVEIKKLGIDITDFSLDHLGYSVSSQKEYDETKKSFQKFSTLIREPAVSGRRVGVFKFKKSLRYQDYSIAAIELIEPKKGERQKSGFEHAEFTIKDSLETLVKKYPHLPWDVTNINRADFPRLKLTFSNGMEVKFNNKAILRD